MASPIRWPACLALCLLAACGPSASGPDAGLRPDAPLAGDSGTADAGRAGPDAGADAGGVPDLAITITSPPGGNVGLGPAPERAVAVEFSVTGFTLRAPGSCGAMPRCGHVRLTIDGAACNASGLPYNNLGVASPLEARFASCLRAEGMHRVTVTLHGDDQAAVRDLNGNDVRSEVNVTTVP